MNFNPRPPRGGRLNKLKGAANMARFQSTPSARRATWGSARRACTATYFNPRPPRGGRQRRSHRTGHAGGISIHALREEGDGVPTLLSATIWNFNPRPPRGGRPSPPTVSCGTHGFQSTPSARRATGCLPRDRQGVHISIHALREEGDQGCTHPVPAAVRISIHALREEGDRTWPAASSWMT